MTKAKPYSVDVPQDVLADLYGKIAQYPWHLMPDLEGWEAGSNKAFMQEICAYWVESFDWREAEARLNRFENFKYIR